MVKNSTHDRSIMYEGAEVDEVMEDRWGKVLSLPFIPMQMENL